MTKARFNLPDLYFAEKSAKAIEESIVNRYELLTGIRLSKADPRRKFIQSLLPLFVQQRSLIDYAAKSNLLSYSFGDYLDHIGLMVDTVRLEAKPANVTVRFNFSINKDMIIPSGTKVGSSKSDVVFFTTKDTQVTPGELSVDVSCECLEKGEIGNGFTPGMIDTLIDPLPWVDSVENTTVSEGGADKESDDRYSERIREAPARFSTAGSTAAYKYWAKTANSLITDVVVYSPSPGVVEIRPLLQNGELPGQEILNTVYEKCNDETVRPLTDFVQVLSPEIVKFNLNLTYWISSESTIDLSTVKARVEKSVSEYIEWQKVKMGRDINPSELIRRIVNAGAKRVHVESPIFAIVEPYQVAIADHINVSFGGIEDE